MKKICCIIILVCFGLLLVGCSNMATKDDQAAYLDEKAELFINAISYLAEEDNYHFSSAFEILSKEEKRKLIETLENKYSFEKFNDVELGTMEQYVNLLNTELDEDFIRQLSEKNHIEYDDYLKNIKDPVFKLLAYYQISFEKYCMSDLNESELERLRDHPEKYYAEYMTQYNLLLTENR